MGNEESSADPCKRCLRLLTFMGVGEFPLGSRSAKDHESFTGIPVISVLKDMKS